MIIFLSTTAYPLQTQPGLTNFTRSVDRSLVCGHLNNNLNDLILGDNYNTKINKLPECLNKLILSKCYSYYIDIFPEKLKDKDKHIKFRILLEVHDDIKKLLLKLVFLLKYHF